MMEKKSLFQYFIEGFTKNYINFKGRARRKEYWGFTLFSFLYFLLVVNLLEYLSEPIMLLSLLVLFLPGLSVGVRRMHDIGKSGTNLLIYFVPLIGGIWLLVLLTTAGDKTANRYGADPKSPALEDELDQIGLE